MNGNASKHVDGSPGVLLSWRNPTAVGVSPHHGYRQGARAPAEAG